MNKLPRKISPCPIIEVVIEIRFDPLVPPDAVFGIIYGLLKKEYPIQKKLPIADIPLGMLPDLEFQPNYQLHSERYIVQVGSHVLSLATKGEYPGWPSLKETLSMLYEEVSGAGVIGVIKRFGMRYIDGFDGNIFDNIRLQIKLDAESYTWPETYFRTVIPAKDEALKAILQITNSIVPVVGKEQEKVSKPSRIDVDVYHDRELPNFFGMANGLVEAAHLFEKKIFYGMLKPEFLKTLNPVYD